MRLARRTGERHAAWGLQFDGEAMAPVLAKCTEQSTAVLSAQMCACVGLTLLKINSIPVRTPDCIQRLMAGCTSATFHFLPADMKPADSKDSPAVRCSDQTMDLDAGAESLSVARPMGRLQDDEQQHVRA